jgi:dTDP-4-dehydrorhamnose reductase
MLRLAHEREELSVVDDQFGSPTWARDLADAIAALVGLWFERGEPWLSQVRGVYHVAGQGCASRLELANAVFELDPRRAEQKLRSVKGVATSAFPLPARRPRFAPLDGSRTKERLGIELPPWRDSLARALSER